MTGTVPIDDRQKRYFVESLARGLAVLSAFTEGRSELSLREVAAAAGVSTPSALRIGHTLLTLGYLTRNPVTKGYRPGPRVLSLGLAALSSMSLLEIAEPYLIELRDLTGETVKMAVLQDTEMVYVARYASRVHPPSGLTFVGSRLPASQTCTGRAILSRLPVGDAQEIVERSRSVTFTERTLVDTAEIMAELERSRERGYGINDQGTTIEHRSAAAALINAVGQPVAAINISVSAQRVSLADLEAKLVPHLLATASAISSLLPPQLHGPLRSPRAPAVQSRSA
jgi:IclR family pca regulon transcriptional regulator